MPSTGKSRWLECTIGASARRPRSSRKNEMSRSPCGTSRSSRSLRSSSSRRARIAPRRWIPTIARRSAPSPVAFFSTIWWARRTSVRRMSSPSRTTFSSAKPPPFLASRDLVKGTRQTVAAPSAAARSGPVRSGAGGGVRRLPALELRLPPLGERDRDRVEVARDDRALEDRARLVADLAAAVAGRDVREREQADVGLARDAGRLARRGVPGLERALALLLHERRLVDEDVGAVGGDADHLARRRVAREHDLAAGAVGADHLLGTDAVDGLPALQPA